MGVRESGGERERQSGKKGERVREREKVGVRESVREKETEG